MLLQLVHMQFECALVLLQDQAAFRCCRRALATQLGEMKHLRNGHPRLSQADKQANPGDIPFPIAAMTICRAPNWLNQANALIVTQGIDAQLCLLRNLLD